MADFSALLGDTLLNGKDEVKTESLNGKDAVLLYFSAQWCGPCKSYTPKLVRLYQKLKAEGKDFEIVFISSDKATEDFDEYYGQMPWLALPFSARTKKQELSQKFKVKGIPSLIVFDGKTGKINTKEGRAAVMQEDAYPWVPPSFDEVFGTTFLGKEEKEVERAHYNDKVVGIYFSAEWCPPCKLFTPQLIKTYNTLKAEGKNLEIVFVSKDRDEGSFASYFKEMPWTAIPFADEARRNKLSDRFNVEGIPALVFIDGTTGKVTNKEGRKALSSGLEYPWTPLLVEELTGVNAGCLNDSPGLIAFLPAESSAEEEKKVYDMFIPEAEKVKAAADAEDEDPAMKFFIAKGNPVVTQVKHVMAMASDGTNPDTVLAVLDISQEGSFHHEAKNIGDLTPDVVCTFIKKFKAGKAPRTPLHTRSHSHGGQECHGGH